MRTLVTAVAAAALLGSLTACSYDEPDEAHRNTDLVAFQTPSADGGQPAAITYNEQLVPASGRIGVENTASGDKTRISLTVDGLVPNRAYGAHVHVKACGAKPADSGPHYQNVKDPITPSVDPQYANASNEVWLDVTTNAEGKATATATVPWKFRAGEANAVVLHAQHTSTHAGHAGTAGDRLACLTSKF